MAFVIQWTGPLGPATTQRDSPVESLACATEMLEKGYTDAVIVDLAENGKAYAPADFARFFRGNEKIMPRGPKGEKRPADVISAPVMVGRQSASALL